MAGRWRGCGRGGNEGMRDLRQECVKSAALARRVSFARRMRPMQARVDLQRLCGRVERWRERREGPRARVPEELWDAAVVVARVEGVHATAKALRFNYYSLKDRVEQAPSEGVGPKEATATPFVEVQMPSLDARGDDSTVVELVGRQGDRMRIVAGASAVDIAGLVQAFWGREP